MGKAGRPRIEIPKEQFESLCAICCTLAEIAGFFKCSEDTIEKWCKRTYKENFADIYKKASSPGKVSLRRMQFRMAEHNASMAIWLGKQWLGQTDAVQVINTVDDESRKQVQDLLNESIPE